ncbi:MAG: HEPN domain-containing protein [Magnetococcales bacterium]|nr:HEPN domain-containing protein [Magnetococcales bacterium]
MSDRETARQLLTMAAKDFRAMTILAHAEPVPVEACGFHAQQAVEKALKAWLALLGQKPPRAHSLSILIQQLETLGVEVEPLWDFAELSPFAVQFRYESLDGMDIGLDIADWLGRVQELVERVETVLAKLAETRPD